MNSPKPPLTSNAVDHSEKRISIDWHKVESIADFQFEPDIRESIECELDWHSRQLEDYAPEFGYREYRKALEAIVAVVKTPKIRERMLPVEDELNRVFWFLEVMAEPVSPKQRIIKVDYILYYQIWSHIGKAGVRLTRGKGLPDNKLSKAQRIFQEICAQAGIGFNSSDQALAKALQRALKACAFTGTNQLV